MLARFESAKSYHRTLERRRSKLLQSTPVLIRHVPLRPDGAGVTLQLRRLDDDRHWSWWFDGELLGSKLLWDMEPVQAAIMKIENEFGLPLSFTPSNEDARSAQEHPRPDGPPESGIAFPAAIFP